MIQVWSCLSIDASQRSHQGNLGYEDVLGESYVWNNTVPNFKNVSAGDLLVLRDSDWVLGFAWIDEIRTEPGLKLQRRCPVCNQTGFDSRKTMSPVYRCSPCDHEFDSPVEEIINVTRYIAEYARTWRSMDEVMPTEVLKTVYLNRSVQQSIRPMSLEGTRELLHQKVNLGERWWDTDGGVRPGGHTLAIQKTRIGQTQFRNELLKRFGHCCAISGSQPLVVLEAAHLYRYADTPHHDIRGGLLLRRDLHTLFDRGLLTVSPNWEVELAPQIRIHEDYASFHGQQLQVPVSLRPEAGYLERHRSQAVDSWDQASG